MSSIKWSLGHLVAGARRAGIICIGASALLVTAPADSAAGGLLDGIQEAVALQRLVKSLEKPSREDQIYLGKQTLASIRAESTVSAHEELTHLGNDLVSRLPGKSKEWPWEFFLIETSEVNAYAAPGGKIFVTSGLVSQIKTVDALAAVLSHEIVHVAKEHSAKQMREINWLDLIAQLGLGKLPSRTRVLDAAVAQELLISKRSRDHEHQADDIGMTLMKAAGYDIAGAVELFDVFVAMSGGMEGGVVTWFSSHPGSTGRREYAVTLQSRLTTQEMAQEELIEKFK